MVKTFINQNFINKYHLNICKLLYSIFIYNVNSTLNKAS